MDVTKDNFAEAARELESLIPTAKFISIDEEMTGIRLPGRDFVEDVLDSVEMRYRKMRAAAMAYSVIQMGICLFHEDPEDPERLIARPYNFFVLPSSDPAESAGPIVRLEMSAIEFNSRHGMNWSKWLHSSVPYVNANGEQALRARLVRETERDEASYRGRDVKDNRRPITLTKPADVEFVDSQAAAFDAFFEASKDEFEEHIAREAAGEELPEDIKPLEFALADCNSFLRAAVYERIRAHHHALEDRSVAFVTRAPVGGARFGTSYVCLLTLGQVERARAASAARRRAEYESRLGFRRVWNLLTAARVPIIGHNCFFDFLFMMQAFECDLPDTFAEFTRLFASLFPTIFCTKFLYHAQELRALPGFIDTGRTHLENLHTLYSSVQRARDAAAAGTPLQPLVRSPKGGYTDVQFGVFTSPAHRRAALLAAPAGLVLADPSVYGEGCNKFHEAAFDAYCTGYVFAHLSCARNRADGLGRAAPAALLAALETVEAVEAEAAAAAASAAAASAAGVVSVTAMGDDDGDGASAAAGAASAAAGAGAAAGAAAAVAGADGPEAWEPSQPSVFGCEIGGTLDSLSNHTYLMFSYNHLCLSPGAALEAFRPVALGTATVVISRVPREAQTPDIVSALAAAADVSAGDIGIRFVGEGVACVTVPATAAAAVRRSAHDQTWAAAALSEYQLELERFAAAAAAESAALGGVASTGTMEPGSLAAAGGASAGLYRPSAGTPARGKRPHPGPSVSAAAAAAAAAVPGADIVAAGGAGGLRMLGDSVAKRSRVLVSLGVAAVGLAGAALGRFFAPAAKQELDGPDRG